MTRCRHCGLSHSSNYHTEKYITDKGFPTHSPRYKSAHEEADKKEKDKFPRGYERLKHIDQKLDRHELAGKNSKTGKITVSKKVPPSLRKEVAYHEKVENGILRKKKK